MTAEPDNPFTALLNEWDDQRRHRPRRALKRDDLDFHYDSILKKTCSRSQCGRSFFAAQLSCSFAH